MNRRVELSTDILFAILLYLALSSIGSVQGEPKVTSIRACEAKILHQIINSHQCPYKGPRIPYYTRGATHGGSLHRNLCIS